MATVVTHVLSWQAHQLCDSVMALVLDMIWFWKTYLFETGQFLLSVCLGAPICWDRCPGCPYYTITSINDLCLFFNGLPNCVWHVLHLCLASCINFIACIPSYLSTMETTILQSSQVLRIASRISGSDDRMTGWQDHDYGFESGRECLAIL